MPKVSVLLTVYNKPQWLNQSIDSVLDQTFADFELIILEDNSPNPEVKEIIESYNDKRIIKFYSDIDDAHRYDTTRYATLINYGGFNIASGDYYTYLSDDDFYYPERLEIMSSYLDKNPEHNVVYSCQDIVDEGGRKSGERRFEGPIHTVWNTIDHNSVMHRRQIFLDHGGWNDDRFCWGGADSYFFKKISAAGNIFYPVSPDKTLEAKRYHTTSVQWMIGNGSFFPKR